ncbi:unnamed protein product [Didymodactylos carnosus]|uniref:Uncharacterized protein n=1 Tax=Didymodactylos carnosus TaxID=1234261 RepID=A0A814ZMN0_9BILA|nr:unnamed protein product [Didymodactylos carnosus]CAF1243900.1 unnamed protein product [Didymodactylos carnosus]CAF3947778.1 unnamed protein product [Didymodactylos carnosus]CAF4008522.1 unnamed protein product [Didymodactylos carnosus]
MMHLCSPAFGYQLSSDIRRKATAIVQFYLKYKHTILNRQLSKDVFKYETQLFNNNIDYVPGLKLNF